MIKILFIGIGGFLGTISRYSLITIISQFSERPLFPLGTLSVNVLGCLLVGVLGAVGEGRQVLSPEVRLFLWVGFLGGFTTFSSFSYETFHLMQDNRILTAMLGVTLQISLGIGAVSLGYFLGRTIT